MSQNIQNLIDYNIADDDPKYNLDGDSYRDPDFCIRIIHDFHFP